MLVLWLVSWALAGDRHDVTLEPGAEQVQVSKGDPPAGSVEIGALTAVHGKGCGAFGFLGDYENARTELRNAAHQARADYVRLDLATEPHLATQQCYDNRFTLMGVGYRLPTTATGAPASVVPPSAVPPANQAAPPPEAYDLAEQVYRALGRARPPGIEAWAADVRAVWYHQQAGRTSDLVVAAARAGGEMVGADKDLALILAAGFGPAPVAAPPVPAPVAPRAAPAPTPRPAPVPPSPADRLSLRLTTPMGVDGAEGSAALRTTLEATSPALASCFGGAAGTVTLALVLKKNGTTSELRTTSGPVGPAACVQQVVAGVITKPVAWPTKIELDVVLAP